MTHVIHPVILSGGAGTRLWPLSRKLYPKQLLPLTGEQSLLQQTLARVADPVRFAAPLLLCNADHRFLIAEQARALDIEPRDIVLEPVARNTAPAACAAAQILADAAPDSLMLLLPSDHFIGDPEAFLEAAERAAAAAAEGWLTTFGITPDAPETGYGYIRQAETLEGLPGCCRVARFVEKPDRITAQRYLANGAYVWNSGMFLFKASRLIEELERFQPEIVSACRKALAAAERDLDFRRLDQTGFAAAPSISIDYAVMEKTDRAAVVPVDMGWTDVGSWDALWRVNGVDDADNKIQGDVIALDVEGCYLHSESRLVAALGLRDLVVVETSDAVLVCPRDRAQDIRLLVERLALAKRDEHQVHRRVFRPWGSYQGIDAGEGFQAKRLIINPGASISLQRHKHRAEHWVVVRGVAEVTRDDEVFQLQTNESAFIPLGAVHRLRNPGEEPLHIVEVQSGGYLGEDDIERFEDIYGRS